LIELAGSTFPGSRREDFIMDTIELRAASQRLTKLHERFAPCFGRRECREHALGYLRGLLLGSGRKSVEPMALVFGGVLPEQPAIEQTVALAWQRFLTVSPWEATAVQQEIQAVFNEEFVPTASRSPIGTIGVIDGSGFVKRGAESVGVQRQWCGRVGKKENCQVGVFLLGVTPAGNALLDHQLYLPETWAADARRAKTRVPPEITFQTKPQIAAALVARSAVRFDWITADEEFGRDGGLLDALESLSQRYLVEVPANTTVWPGKPLRQTPDELVWQVSQLAQTIPVKAWRVIQLREGAKGPLAFAFTRLRVWSVRHRHAGPPVWLVIRRSLERVPEVKYYVSNAAPEVPLETMALVTGSRWPVEEFFEDAKGQLGMAHYEARSWTSWHHHMSLVALAYLYVVQTRRDLNRQVPDLTIDMAMRLLRAALPRPQLTLQDAEELIDYYRDRNKLATASHRKTWLAKHPNVVPKSDAVELESCKSIYDAAARCARIVETNASDGESLRR
jgi:SRSO17 transposase